jgi:uncharacterized protein (DUF305 family)
MTRRIVAVVVAFIAVSVVGACSSDQHAAPSATTSSDQSDHNASDITFAHSMIPHHEQAVDMAQMVPTQTENKQIVDLANKIIAAQVPEIAAFRARLMEWQDAQGHDPAGHGSAPMAGMVDQATVDKLRTLTGAEFDRLWLTSMIAHHQGAIAMAQDEVAHGKNPDVIYLAKSIITGQQAEIDQMKQMLGG